LLILDFWVSKISNYPQAWELCLRLFTITIHCTFIPLLLWCVCDRG
jgi:hypothetical protein